MTGQVAKSMINDDTLFRFDMLVNHNSLFIMDNEKLTETVFQLWLSDSPVTFQAQSLEQKNRFLNALRGAISHTPLQSETQSQLQRHVSQTHKPLSLSLSKKKRSISLTSSGGSKERLPIPSFDLILKNINMENQRSILRILNWMSFCVIHWD